MFLHFIDHYFCPLKPCFPNISLQYFLSPSYAALLLMLSHLIRGFVFVFPNQPLSTSSGMAMWHPGVRNGTFSGCFFFSSLTLTWGYVLIDFQERERERGASVRKNINQLPPVHAPTAIERATYIRALTRNRTCSLMVWGTQLQPSEPLGRGYCLTL